MKVVLSKNWQANIFRRCIRDPKTSEVKKTLEFPRGVVVDVDKEGEAAITDSIGRALTICDKDNKPDMDETQKFCAGVAKARIANNAKKGAKKIEILEHQQKAFDVLPQKKGGSSPEPKEKEEDS